MNDLYSIIDNSILPQFLFYPQRRHSKPDGDAFDLIVEVDQDVKIVCRAYPAANDAPWLLYFHGNGEVVSDYDDISQFYNSRGLNLFVADYRGYGASSGHPTFTAMVSDAGKILNYAGKELKADGFSGSWLVMGRSMGSVSALELASRSGDELSGMIIESGFISVSKLIRHLGLPSPGNLKPIEDESFKIAASINLPSLVIHGEHDRLVPLEQGRELYETIGSAQKELLIIPHAEHNDIMFVDTDKYMDAIKNFCESVLNHNRGG